MVAIYILLSLILLGVLYLVFAVTRAWGRSWLRFYHMAYAEPERRRAAAADDGSPVARLVNALLREAISQEAWELVLSPQKEGIQLVLPSGSKPWTVALKEDGQEEQVRLPRQVFPLVVDRLKHLAQVSLELKGGELRGMIRANHLANSWNITAQFAPTQDGGAEQVTLRLVQAH